MYLSHCLSLHKIQKEVHEQEKQCTFSTLTQEPLLLKKKF